MKRLVLGSIGLAAVLTAQVWVDRESQPPAGALPLALAGANGPAAFGASLAQDGAGVAYSAFRPASSASARFTEVIPDEVLTAIVARNCAICHNDQLGTANLSLTGFDVSKAGDHWQEAERVITKLRLEMMPPPGLPRPGGDTLMILAQTLEDRVGAVAAAQPNPGFRSFQRLNRSEYAAAIKQLLALEVDAGSWLPMDQVLAGFDNMPDAQTLSPALLDAYLRAAGSISRMAVGDRDATPVGATYSQRSEASQHEWDRVEGAPMGTRGGMVVRHLFPADGEYVFEVSTGGGNGATFQELDLSIDGQPVASLPMEPGLPRVLRTDRIFVKAGQQSVSAAFVRLTEGPYEDLLRPHEWSFAGGGGGAYGITDIPHLEEIVITGPFNPVGVSETESRAMIFTCRPAAPSEETACAEEILGRLASQAFRRPVRAEDLSALMSFYAEGAREGGFENGVRFGLQAILASPHFIFRIERAPTGVAQGEAFRLADVDLASRLSFFLWNSSPDDELLSIAMAGKLYDPGVLEAQTRRLLADPRSEALGTRFINQWLRLGNLYEVRPDAFLFPNFSENLRRDMMRETELFFHHLVKEDRSAMELFTADYTVINERLAKHYDIPGVVGDHFRPVQYPATVNRRGILGHASILMLTSMGNRTSPVVRGVWFFDVLLGAPPPPPPPNVPMLDQTDSVAEDRVLNTRERFAVHRANPACGACHNSIDPIGVSLDNYDVLGRWRTRENGVPVSAEDKLWDGTPVQGPADVVASLSRRPVPLMRNFMTYMMAYAVGRPMEYYDKPAIRRIVDEAAANDFSISSLVLGVVQSAPFQMKVADAVTADDADQE